MASIKVAEAAPWDFIGECRRHGLKVTPQRMAIYSALKGCVEHPSADFVYRQVKKEFPGISFETVNRTLLTFAAIGLISVVESTSGVRRFDPDMKSHHHLHCIRCGRIIDIRDEGFDTIDVPGQLSEMYRIVGKRVVLHMICPDCLTPESSLPETVQG
ncbi:MAG: transcriptional repressor [Chlorobi bacterium]|nr:transcriptional repressor [Chlorobiota bacterium]